MAACTLAVSVAAAVVSQSVILVRIAHAMMCKKVVQPTALDLTGTPCCSCRLSQQATPQC